jgi:hypothetical protein
MDPRIDPRIPDESRDPSDEGGVRGREEGVRGREEGVRGREEPAGRAGREQAAKGKLVLAAAGLAAQADEQRRDDAGEHRDGALQHGHASDLEQVDRLVLELVRGVPGG